MIRRKFNLSWIIDILNKFDGPQKHYTKWTKLISQGHIPHEIPKWQNYGDGEQIVLLGVRGCGEKLCKYSGTAGREMFVVMEHFWISILMVR